MIKHWIGAAALAAAVGVGTLAGCSTAPKSEADKQTLAAEVQTALQAFKNADSSLQGFLDKSYGYAVFPDVGKGGLGLGGAYGRGQVFEQGRLIGYCDLSQATIGLQAGAQTYSELIVFENKEALDRFTSGRFEFSANASAVALKAGAAAAADYTNGVAVFTLTKGGLMAEASVGGQKFTFQPL